MAVPGPLLFGFYFVLIALAVMFHLAVNRYKLFPTVLMLSFALQIIAVVAVPLVVLIIRWCGKASCEERPFQREPIHIKWFPSLTTCIGFCTIGVSIWLISNTLIELQIWRVAAALECFAFGILGLKVMAMKSITGISLRKIALDAIRLAFRLIAAAWLGRRLPRKSYDGIVQGADAFAFSMTMVVLCYAYTSRRATCRAEADTFQIWHMALGALILAAVLHVDIGHEYIPDVLWTAALYLDVTAMLPQMKLIAQNGGVVDEAMSHHIAMFFGSRLLGLTFWWLIRGTWSRGLTWTGWGILIFYMIELLLLSHYMCYYFKGCFNRGLFSGIPLVCADR